MFQRTDVIEKKRTYEELSASSDDENYAHPKAIIPGLQYLVYFSAESPHRLLNHAIVEIIMIFDSYKSADDLSHQLALFCQARAECIIYADHIKVTSIAELENKGNFRRIYLAPQSNAALNTKYNPNMRSKFIMQQLHDLYDLSTAGKIVCNISKLQITSRSNAQKAVSTEPVRAILSNQGHV